MTFAKTQGFYRACCDSFSFYVGSLKGKVTNCIPETSLLRGYVPDTSLYANVALYHIRYVFRYRLPLSGECVSKNLRLQCVSHLESILSLCRYVAITFIGLYT